MVRKTTTMPCKDSVCSGPQGRPTTMLWRQRSWRGGEMRVWAWPWAWLQAGDEGLGASWYGAWGLEEDATRASMTKSHRLALAIYPRTLPHIRPPASCTEEFDSQQARDYDCWFVVASSPHCRVMVVRLWIRMLSKEALTRTGGGRRGSKIAVAETKRWNIQWARV